MSDEKQRPKGTATLTLERDAAERAERLERERLASAERSVAMAADAERDRATLQAWQRTVMLLVLVLLVLVAGLVGVGVTGEIPGVGEIAIDRPGDVERKAPGIERANAAEEAP
jgi:hypothetical protein